MPESLICRRSSFAGTIRPCPCMSLRLRTAWASGWTELQCARHFHRPTQGVCLRGRVSVVRWRTDLLGSAPILGLVLAILRIVTVLGMIRRYHPEVRRSLAVFLFGII